MSINSADYPTTVWDGTSPSRTGRSQDAAPDYEDWDQIVAELIATQTELDAAKAVVLTKSITVTSAQLLACNTTPVEIIAAPGAGYAIIVEHVVAKMNYLTAAYAFTTVANLSYTDESGAVIQDYTALFLETAASAISSHCPNALTGADAATRVVENAAVVFAAPDADPTTGAGSLTFNIRYRIVAL